MWRNLWPYKLTSSEMATSELFFCFRRIPTDPVTTDPGPVSQSKSWLLSLLLTLCPYLKLAYEWLISNLAFVFPESIVSGGCNFIFWTSLFVAEKKYIKAKLNTLSQSVSSWTKVGLQIQKARLEFKIIALQKVGYNSVPHFFPQWLLEVVGMVEPYLWDDSAIAAVKAKGVVRRRPGRVMSWRN